MYAQTHTHIYIVYVYVHMISLILSNKNYAFLCIVISFPDRHGSENGRQNF